MRKAFALLLILWLPTIIVAQANQAAQSHLLVFNHVTVIDMTGAPPKPDMSVVIQGNRIVAIGKSSKTRIPKAARVIDATRKFLIPGLWDMHVHLGDEEFDRRSFLSLFIANGVTGVRIMRGLAEHFQWRKEIEKGMLLGPRMFIAMQIDDESQAQASQIREAARKAQREGADFFKVQDNLPRDAYFALMSEARSLGLPVEGHVPRSVTAAEASEAGQKSIEHLTGLDEAKDDERKAEALISIFRKNGTWQCPTVNMRNNYAQLDDAGLASDPRLKYVKPSWRERWLRMTKDAVNMPASEWTNRRELMRKEKALVARMQRAGLGLLAGTDDANPYSYPGFSLHDELAILVEAGLTPMQALQTATLNPAKFLKRLDSLGTVEKGKLADLVLLDANPLENISHTKRIHAVVVHGKYFAKEALQQLLREVKAAARKR
jgi:imidazolonepropionase-like amidohydrolase